MEPLLTVIYIGQSRGCFCFSTPTVMSHMSKSKTFPPSLKFLEFGVKITRKNLNRFLLPRDSEPSNLGSISPPLTRFVTQTNFFWGLPTTPCHKKNKKYFESGTAKTCLLLDFYNAVIKKKNLGPAIVFLNDTKITRERRIETNCDKTQNKPFFFKRH